MKVLFLPVSNDNPYQVELSNALEEKDISVTIQGGYPIQTLKSIYENGIPDIIHLHWLTPFIIGNNILSSVVKTIVFFIAILASKAYGIPIIWTVHNLFEHDKRYPRWELAIKSIFCRWIASEIIVHCCSAKKQVQEEYVSVNNNKFNVIPHGNYINTYQNNISKDKAREHLGISSEETVFLYFGLIRPYKQISHLIKQFNELDLDNIHLFIVGNPDTESIENRIKNLASNNPQITTHLRYIPEEDVQIYFNAADTAVFAYRDILTSGAIVLATSFKKAVVAPKIGCIPEMVSDKGSFLYQRSDPNGLKDAMYRATESDLETAGNSNYENIRDFDWETIADMTLKVYNS